jgi:hypothetical protein
VGRIEMQLPRMHVDGECLRVIWQCLAPVL